MSKRLMIAMLLVFASAGAHAQNTSTPHSEGTAQTGNDAESDAATTGKRAPHPASTDARKNPRSDAARSQQRWHSFLPGMFR